MNLLLTFMDLDKLYESSQRLDRAAIIKNIENSGRNYDFEKYSDEQLFRMWEKIQKETAELAAMHDINMEDAVEPSICPECSTRLNDGGTCPICDDGEEHLNEDKFPIGTPFQYTTESGKYIIRIMWTGSKFKAIANDGIHGSNSVIFINKFAKHNGELYEVDELEWTGKNYRAIGNIKSIGNIVDLYQQFNNKNINKENLEMNFSSVFEELSHLYESDELDTETTGAAEEGDLEEGIFGFGKKKSKAKSNSSNSNAKDPSKVTYTIYDENGREQFSHTFTENPGKIGADEQLKHLIKDQYPSIYAKCKNYDTARKWQYQRQSVPKSSFDTNRNYNYYVSELNIR